MMRKTSVARASKLSSFFLKVRDGHDPKKIKLSDAVTGRGTNQSFDPVYSKFIHESIMRPMRKNSANASNLETDFLQADEFAKWMDAEQAARVLGIKKEELIGLKPARIEQAWAALYKANRYSHGKKNEVTSAAEILMAYCDSDLAVRKQKEYYTKTLENMRLDIEKELGKDTAQYREWFMQGTGLMMLVGGVIMIMVMYVKRFTQRETLDSAQKSIANYMNVVVARPSNVEPAPNYITRYRDTPTAIDIDRANGVDFDHTHTELAVKHDLKQAERDEDAYLLNMMNEENEQVLREAKAARQSSWNPHAASEEVKQPNLAESSPNATAVASPSAKMTLTVSSSESSTAAKSNDSKGVIVLPLTGKAIERESYTPTFISFMETVEKRMPSAMIARAANIQGKGNDQNETLERAQAFQQLIKEEEGEDGSGN